MNDIEYTQSIAIDDAIRLEYDIKDIFEESPVDFYICANVGFPAFSVSKPIENPDGILEVAIGHRIAQMVGIITYCERRGWDWDVDEHRLEATSREMERQEYSDYVASLPFPYH